MNIKNLGIFLHNVEIYKIKDKTDYYSHDNTIKDSESRNEDHAAVFPQANIVYQKG